MITERVSRYRGRMDGWYVVDAATGVARRSRPARRKPSAEGEEEEELVLSRLCLWVGTRG